MTTRKEVLAALADRSTDLSEALRLLIQLPESILSASDRSWAEKELGGYPDRSTLPDFRASVVQSRGTLTNGTYVQSDFRVDGRFLPDDVQQWCDTPLYVLEGVTEIEDLLTRAESASSNLAVEWPQSAITILNHAIAQGAVRDIPGTQWFTSIHKEMPRGVLIEILERVRIRAVQCVGQDEFNTEFDVQNIRPEPGMNTSVITVEGGVNQFMIQSQDSTQILLAVEQGNFESLRTVLNDLGVSNDAIEALRDVLDNEPDEVTKFGKALDWIKTQAKSVPGQVAVTLISTAILHFLGIA